MNPAFVDATALQDRPVAELRQQPAQVQELRRDEQDLRAAEPSE